jgi:hypothetical protein
MSAEGILRFLLRPIHLPNRGLNANWIDRVEHGLLFLSSRR